MNDKVIHLTSIDLKIIKALKDGRRSLGEIAEETGLTLSTLRRKVIKMQNDNAIQIICLVDPYVINNHSSAFIAFKFEPNNIYLGAKQLESLKGVVVSALVSGGYNAMAVVMFNESFSFENFIMDEILKLEGLISMESFLSIKGGKNYQLRYVL